MPNDGAVSRTEDPVQAFYLHVLRTLRQANADFLVGGAFALRHHVGIDRDTKDFDIFVRRSDYDSIMAALNASGCNTELTYPHWLGKARCDCALVDVIFSSGNGIALVDDEWFQHAATGTVLDVPVKLCPPEEMIWSKAFIQERERFDGGDVMHILLGCAESLDWQRLLRRFGPHWRVLFSYVCLFGFVYPSERARLPEWVVTTLMERMEKELRTPPPPTRICQGTLLSREQYLPDIERWGFLDVRLTRGSNMTEEQVEQWTEAIAHKNEH